MPPTMSFLAVTLPSWLDVFLDEHFDNARMERVYPNAKKT